MIALHSLTKQYGRCKDRYLELIREFPLKPIKTESELEAATKVIHRLIDRESLTAPEDDYLEVLSDLVHDYEEILYPMGENIPDGEMLAELLTNRELSQSQFAKDVGIAVSTVSEVMKGKREFTRKQLEKVSAYFNVSRDLFRSSAKSS